MSKFVDRKKKRIEERNVRMVKFTNEVDHEGVVTVLKEKEREEEEEE